MSADVLAAPVRGAETAAADAALSAVGLSHAFGTRKALDEVSFSVRPGDFTVLLGLNGAGKTTLFALVTRLYHAEQGRVAVFGDDMRIRPAAALARMGVVFQQPTLDLDLTVEQNLCYHASLHGMSHATARGRIDAELARVSLADRRRDGADEPTMRSHLLQLAVSPLALSTVAYWLRPDGRASQSAVH
jgi:ABC-type multidrug transport system ATPase subunit